MLHVLFCFDLLAAFIVLEFNFHFWFFFSPSFCEVSAGLAADMIPFVWVSVSVALVHLSDSCGMCESCALCRNYETVDER